MAGELTFWVKTKTRGKMPLALTGKMPVPLYNGFAPYGEQDMMCSWA
jgi:hypothetical protein